MLTLYSAKGACSLAPHIILEATGLNYRVVHVDLRAKKLEDGGDYLAINPKGAVPALGLDAAAGAEGEVLTENAVILQYLADRVPGSGLLPAAGLDRYRTLEWVNYITTELHKGFGPLFNPALPEDARPLQLALIRKEARLCRPGARRWTRLPHRHRLPHLRRLPVRHPALDRQFRNRPRALAGAHRLPSARRPAASGRRSTPARGDRRLGSRPSALLFFPTPGGLTKSATASAQRVGTNRLRQRSPDTNL